MIAQFSFVIIKPDALERGIAGQIITRIENAYLRIGGMQTRHKSRKWCELHYSHLVSENFFDTLVEFMTARPVIGFAAAGPNAIQRMRNLVGPTNPLEAPAGTIRGDYGHFPPMYNCIHASDSEEAAAREATLFSNITTDLSYEEIKKHASPALPIEG